VHYPKTYDLVDGWEQASFESLSFSLADVFYEFGVKQDVAVLLSMLERV
jgi:hypothetical protein